MFPCLCSVFLCLLTHDGRNFCVYKTPWQSDPRVNIQEKNGKAKVYQVKQVLAAIEKIEGMKDD